MTEAIYYSIGGVSLAAILAAFNAWLERKSGRYTRRAIAHRIAHRLLAWEAGDIARESAKALAMARKPELV